MYAAFIWAHKAYDNKKIETALNSVQRLASLMITGAISKTPTSALEIMASLRPIHDMVRITAAKTALRLIANNDWVTHNQRLNSKRSYYHTLPTNNDLKDIKDIDYMDLIPKTTINTTCQINPYNHSDIGNIISNIPSDEIKIYTDGSLIPENNSNKTGAGVFITHNNITVQQYAFTLDNNASIFQCEMFAILKAAEWIIKKDIKFKNIYILSDSQSALKALNKNETKSSIVLNTSNELNKANWLNNIIILKVPAHTGLQGNEIADKLAKLGTKNKECAQTHKVRRSINSILNELKEKLYREHVTRLGKSNISDKAKIPMTEVLKKYKYKIDIPNRHNLMMVTQIMTGTSILNYSRSVRKKGRSPFCKFCPNIRETSEHFLTNCVKLTNEREQCFGKSKTSTKEIIKGIEWADIIEFIKHSNRFQRKTKDSEKK